MCRSCLSDKKNGKVRFLSTGPFFVNATKDHGCGLMVNKIGVNHEVSRSNFSGDERILGYSFSYVQSSIGLVTRFLCWWEVVGMSGISLVVCRLAQTLIKVFWGYAPLVELQKVVDNAHS